MKLKAVIFGVVTVVTAGLVFFTGKAKASPAPPPPDPPPGPKPAPPPSPTVPCANGIGSGVSMSLSTAQGALNKAGANPQLATDGKFGPATKNAIAEFQWASGLPQTGCVDVATAKALQPYVTAAGPYRETYVDQNKMKWTITRPTLSVWRAQQDVIDVTGEGGWQKPYPEVPDTFEMGSRASLIDRIEAMVGSYEV
jgi:peptidoglycan hydrolase-like protein with peptidoglycan-binding domain